MTRVTIHFEALARVLRFVPLRSAIAIAFVIAVPVVARAHGAAVHATEGIDPAVASGSRSRSSWGPVLAGCFGVLFGAGVAVWQIRGRSRND